MKYCGECGCENFDEAKFCRDCGLRFPSSFEEISVGQNTVLKENQNVSDNQNEESVVSRLFYKTDKYTNELRFAKTKSISILVFILMFIFELFIVKGGPIAAVVLAAIIMGLIFAVPTFVIGTVIGYVADRISH